MIRGEPIGFSDTQTVTFAVPPRISGPYDGSQLTCEAARHRGVGEDLAGQQHALAAEAGHQHLGSEHARLLSGRYRHTGCGSAAGFFAGSLITPSG